MAAMASAGRDRRCPHSSKLRARALVLGRKGQPASRRCSWTGDDGGHSRRTQAHAKCGLATPQWICGSFPLLVGGGATLQWLGAIHKCPGECRSRWELAGGDRALQRLESTATRGRHPPESAARSSPTQLYTRRTALCPVAAWQAPPPRSTWTPIPWNGRCNIRAGGRTPSVPGSRSARTPSPLCPRPDAAHVRWERKSRSPQPRTRNKTRSVHDGMRCLRPVSYVRVPLSNL